VVNLKKASYGILIILVFLLSTSLLQSESFTITPTSQNLENKNNEGESIAAPSHSESFEESNSSIVLWSKTYGGADEDCAYSIVLQTSDGGFVLAGSTYSFGAGGSDFWLVKTDWLGNMRWNKTYGGLGDDEAHFVVRSADGGFAVVGTTNSFGATGYDVWLIKIDSSGNMLWNKTYGGVGSDEAWSVVNTADGGFALAGWTASFGAGSGDLWLVKTDALGNAEWNKTYGGTLFEAANSLKQTSDGGFVLAGSTYSFGSGGSDFWLIKTDNFGNIQWNRTYGGTNEDYGFSVVQTFDGGYAIAGSTSSFGLGVYDFWLVKTDHLGNLMWNKTYGGIGYDEAWLILQTASNELALIGWTESFGSGNSDCWLIITDAQGDTQWNKTWGGENYDYAYSAVLTADGGYVLAGETQSFGAGSYDFLLIKIRENEEMIIGGGCGGGRKVLK